MRGLWFHARVFSGRRIDVWAVIVSMFNNMKAWFVNLEISITINNYFERRKRRKREKSK